jgi:hypothetical protein
MPEDRMRELKVGECAVKILLDLESRDQPVNLLFHFGGPGHVLLCRSAVLTGFPAEIASAG